MKINPIVNSNPNQTNFKAVNQKYLKEAENWYKRIGDIDSSWYESLRDDVCLFGDISSKDGIDTMNAIKKYVKEGSKSCYNHILECIKRG